MGVTVTDTKTYTQSFGGSQHNAIIVTGFADNGTPIVSRASGVRWGTDRSVSQADELNTPKVKETNYNREEPTRGTMDAVFTLEQNDNMPNADTLWDTPDMTVFVYVTRNGKKYYTDVFLGVKLTNDGSAVQVGQNRMANVAFLALQHIRGIDYKAINGSVDYPATVS